MKKSGLLAGKTVVLGITGSIAAYKMANVASMLVKMGCDVHVIMTGNATNFINPITFETLTNHKCLVETFDRNFQFHVAHVSLAKQADVFLVAPASANIIGKMAGGMADDMLSTTLMAAKCPILIAPAMNSAMYENRIVQDNLAKLERFGIKQIRPEVGYLACGDVGAGKMPSEAVLVDYVVKEIAKEKDMTGMSVLVTAGPTQEAMDPVRYITNHSTGKMGYAIAKMAMLRGAEVTLVSGPVTLTPPPFVNVVQVRSAKEMFEAVKVRSGESNILIMTAAVADYRPAEQSAHKIKKVQEGLTLQLERTDDILAYLGEHKTSGQVICGFSMETEHLLENSAAKLEKKQADLIAANSLTEAGAGFGTETNHLTLIMRDKTVDLPMLKKEEAADELLTQLLQLS